MKKIIFIFMLVFFLVLALITLRANHIILNKGVVPKDGFVPDEETAIKIAETVLESIYGDAINDEKPFNVDYISTKGVWKVTGSLPENHFGGVAEIRIKKSNGKIIYVSHSK